MTQQELARLLASPAGGGSELDSLGDRELEVVSLLAQGNGFSRAAQEMGLSEERFGDLKKGLQKKLKLKNDVQLLQFAARQRG